MIDDEKARAEDSALYRVMRLLSNPRHDVEFVSTVDWAEAYEAISEKLSEVVVLLEQIYGPGWRVKSTHNTIMGHGAIHIINTEPMKAVPPRRRPIRQRVAA